MILPVFHNFINCKTSKPNNTYNKPTYLYKSKLTDDVFEKSKTQISFQGVELEAVNALTEEVSKRTHSKKRMIEIYNNYPEAKGLTIGGGLPDVWMNRIENVEDFDKFGFLERLGKIFTVDRHFADIDVLRESLTELFRTYGILKPEDTLNVKYLQKGNFGRAFRIFINDDRGQVIKEYKRTYNYHNNHGNYSEQSLAEYIRAFAGDDSNIVKYYWGDTNNGILVVDYINEDYPEPKNKIKLENLGLAYADDKPRNFVGDYIIDIGGLITINNLMGNKKAQKIYTTFENMNDDTQKIDLFNKILEKNINENNIDDLVGLTHSIKFLPEDKKGEYYYKMYDFNKKAVNIALVENIKNFGYEFDRMPLIEALASSTDSKIQEVCAREITSFPEKLKHRLFETLSLEDNPKIKKYLARNLNHYYMNLPNRINIYDNLAKNNDDIYADVALINSLQYLSKKHIEERFEKFFNKNNLLVMETLARSIEFFSEDELKMEKWVNKLMDVDNPRVYRALSESLSFMPEDLRLKTFERLLNVDDMNTKEILAEQIVQLPNYCRHLDWLDKLLNGADNTVRRALAHHLPSMPSVTMQKEWMAKVLVNSDSSVREIIEKNKKMYN